MRQVERTIAVLGSTSVGKSAVTIRFVDDRFSPDYDPTIFRSHRHQIRLNDTDYGLVLYDTAGLDQQSTISGHYIKSNGFILVYSIADRQSFDIVKYIYETLVEELMHSNIPIVLVGNKSDLEQRQVNYEEGVRLAKEINAGFFETSARDGTNIREGFVALLNRIDHPTPLNNNNNNQIVNNNNIPNGGTLNSNANQQANNRTSTSTTSTPSSNNNGNVNSNNLNNQKLNNQNQQQRQQQQQQQIDNGKNKSCTIS